MTLFNTDPNTDPNTDLNTDPNTDPNTDIFYFKTPISEKSYEFRNRLLGLFKFSKNNFLKF